MCRSKDRAPAVVAALALLVARARELHVAVLVSADTFADDALAAAVGAGSQQPPIEPEVARRRALGDK